MKIIHSEDSLVHSEEVLVVMETASRFSYHGKYTGSCAFLIVYLCGC